jgi:large subunit ribosomal protein L22
MEARKLTRKEKIALDKESGKSTKPMKKSKARQQKRKLKRANEIGASLRNYPSSPRKMRYVADMIRGMNVEQALIQLKLCTKWAAVPLRKLLLSAINNWQEKTGQRLDYNDVYIKAITVDGGRMLKRVQPAPQGRAYIKRKRSNHVKIILDSKVSIQE